MLDPEKEEIELEEAEEDDLIFTCQEWDEIMWIRETIHCDDPIERLRVNDYSNL